MPRTDIASENGRPGIIPTRETFTVLSNMAWCHIKAYELIHSLRREMGYTDTRVGFANHLRVFEPKNPANPWHRLCAKAARWLFQGAITEAMSLGRFRFPLRNRGRLPRGEYSDFNGINYYTRSSRGPDWPTEPGTTARATT